MPKLPSSGDESPKGKSHGAKDAQPSRISEVAGSQASKLPKVPGLKAGGLGSKLGNKTGGKLPGGPLKALKGIKRGADSLRENGVGGTAKNMAKGGAKKAAAAAKAAAKYLTKRVLKSTGKAVVRAGIQAITSCVASVVCLLVAAVVALLLFLVSLVVMSVFDSERPPDSGAAGTYTGDSSSTYINDKNAESRSSADLASEAREEYRTLEEHWKLSADQTVSPVDQLRRWVSSATSNPDDLKRIRVDLDRRRNSDVSCDWLLVGAEGDRLEFLTKEVEQLHEADQFACERMHGSIIAWTGALRYIGAIGEDTPLYLLPDSGFYPIRHAMFVENVDGPATEDGWDGFRRSSEWSNQAADAAGLQAVALWASSGLATPEDDADGWLSLVWEEKLQEGAHCRGWVLDRDPNAEPRVLLETPCAGPPDISVCDSEIYTGNEVQGYRPAESEVTPGDGELGDGHYHQDEPQGETAGLPHCNAAANAAQTFIDDLCCDTPQEGAYDPTSASVGWIQKSARPGNNLECGYEGDPVEEWTYYLCGIGQANPAVEVTTTFETPQVVLEGEEPETNTVTTWEWDDDRPVFVGLVTIDWRWSPNPPTPPEFGHFLRFVLDPYEKGLFADVHTRVAGTAFNEVAALGWTPHGWSDEDGERYEDGFTEYQSWLNGDFAEDETPCLSPLRLVVKQSQQQKESEPTADGYRQEYRQCDIIPRSQLAQWGWSTRSAILGINESLFVETLVLRWDGANIPECPSEYEVSRPWQSEPPLVTLQITIIDDDGGRTGDKKTGLTIHPCIMQRVKKLWSLAWDDGFQLTASGYRSNATQVSIWTSQGCEIKCNIPVATPGTSNHEYGLAIDFGSGCFSDEGLARSYETPCFRWVNENMIESGIPHPRPRGAVTPGASFCRDEDHMLLNFCAKEAWHWSVNGG